MYTRKNMVGFLRILALVAILFLVFFLFFNDRMNTDLIQNRNPPLVPSTGRCPHCSRNRAHPTAINENIEQKNPIENAVTVPHDTIKEEVGKLSDSSCDDMKEHVEEKNPIENLSNPCDPVQENISQ